MSQAIVIELVKQIREQMPRIGTRKLHYMLSDKLGQHGIKMGRDKLFDLLEESGLLVRRRKRRRVSTTDSRHPFRRYPNLIKELVVKRPEHLWVSDITYLALKEDFCYLSLVTDAYSRKIVGHCLWPTLKKEGPLQALTMAMEGWTRQKDTPLIHHSDRGLQYCCGAYTGLLSENNISISMTEKGDPYENAKAERVNGILKTEFLLDREFEDFEQAGQAVEAAIHIYNSLRPHASCDYHTPAQAHRLQGTIAQRWKQKKKKALDSIMQPAGGSLF